MPEHISLSLTEDYAPSWGAWEGVRELVQNFHDGCLEHGPVTFERQRLADSADHRFEALAAGVSVGSAIYDSEHKRLTLANRRVALHRRSLLLGASRKASGEAIGQFGEGMKVGALALLREGRRVEMSTRDEHWRWLRRLDDAFGVRVLTVEVSARSTAERTSAEMERAASDDEADGSVREARGAALWVELGEADTCTTVGPLEPEEWARFSQRFLFLVPAEDCFSCELGALLLEDRLAGQLYVKGIWIANLLDDGLNSGLNFRHMPLDRDRRAVLHLSDLESQAAAM